VQFLEGRVASSLLAEIALDSQKQLARAEIRRQSIARGCKFTRNGGKEDAKVFSRHGLGVSDGCPRGGILA
jgi:hypothetical protein